MIAIEGAKANICSNVIAPLAKTRLTEELMGPMADVLQPEQVSGLVAYLCSPQSCEPTHEVFSVGGGRIARVFVGLGPGLGGRQGRRAHAPRTWPRTSTRSVPPTATPSRARPPTR